MVYPDPPEYPPSPFPTWCLWAGWVWVWAAVVALCVWLGRLATDKVTVLAPPVLPRE